MTEVTQADREAAAQIMECHERQKMADLIRAGDRDNSNTVQIVARHREASEAPLRERIAQLEADRDALAEALDWAIAEIEGRTRYTPNDIYEAEEQRENALGKAQVVANLRALLAANKMLKTVDKP